MHQHPIPPPSTTVSYQQLKRLSRIAADTSLNSQHLRLPSEPTLTPTMLSAPGPSTSEGFLASSSLPPVSVSKLPMVADTIMSRSLRTARRKTFAATTLVDGDEKRTRKTKKTERWVVPTNQTGVKMDSRTFSSKEVKLLSVSLLMIP